MVPASPGVLINKPTLSFFMESTTNLELTTIAALAGKRKPEHFHQGDVIFKAGEIGDKVYGVVSGQVEMRWGDDRLETIGAGSCFGVAASAQLWPAASVSC